MNMGVWAKIMDDDDNWRKRWSGIFKIEKWIPRVTIG